MMMAGLRVMGNAAKLLLTWAPVSAMGSPLSMYGAPATGPFNLRELSHDSAGTARCGACLPSSKKNADVEVMGSAAVNGLRAGFRDRFPCNKRPANLTDMVEHIAPCGMPLEPGSPAWGFDHVLSDVVAQTVDLILVAMLKHAGKVRHARFKAVEGIATRRFKVRDARQGTHLNEDVEGVHKPLLQVTEAPIAFIKCRS